jgi:hypothetical protein
MKIRKIAEELTARGAVLHVLRNGRPRHIGEIRDRMRDRGWDLEVPHIRQEKPRQDRPCDLSHKIEAFGAVGIPATASRRFLCLVASEHWRGSARGVPSEIVNHLALGDLCWRRSAVAPTGDATPDAAQDRAGGAGMTVSSRLAESVDLTNKARSLCRRPGECEAFGCSGWCMYELMRQRRSEAPPPADYVREAATHAETRLGALGRLWRALWRYLNRCDICEDVGWCNAHPKGRRNDWRWW